MLPPLPQPPRPNYPNPAPRRTGLGVWRSLMRPQVWLSGLGLIGFGVLAWQFSQRPEWRQALWPSNPSSSLDANAQENQAIGGDIDSSALLNADLMGGSAKLLDASLGQDPLAKSKSPSDNTAAAKNNPLSLESLLGGIGANQSGLGTGSLAGSIGGGLIGGGTSAPGFTFSTGLNNPGNSYPGNSLANRTNSNGNNLLNSALNRYSPATPNPNAPFAVKPSEPTTTPRPSPSPIAGTTGFTPSPVPEPPGNPVAGTSAVNPALLANPQSSTANSGLNSYTGLSSGAVPDSLPESYYPSRSPDLGVATPSPILRSPSSGNIPVPIGSTPMPPGGSATPIAVPAPQPDPPFSVPRSTPGRSIGGGEIGTFSNP
jgi:hypothetical protein